MPDTQSTKSDKDSSLTPDQFMQGTGAGAGTGTSTGAGSPSTALTPDQFMSSITSPASSSRQPTTEQRIRKRAQKYFADHPVVREGLLGGFAGMGLPESTHPVSDTLKGLWHTLTDEPKTKDEKGVVLVGGPLSLPAYRMAKGFLQQEYGFGQDVFDSIDWSKADMSKLKLPEFKSGDEGAPKFAHGLAGMVTSILTLIKGGEKAPEAIEAVSKAGESVADTARTGTRVLSQEIAGAGRERVQSEVRERGVRVQEREAAHAAEERRVAEANAEAAAKHSREVEQVASENAEATAAYRQKLADSIAEHDAKVEAANKQYANDVAARERKVAELNAQHADAVAKARAEWVRKAYESREGERQLAKVEARREALKSGQDAYAKLIDENVKATHAATRGALDERWNALREKVGIESPVKAPPLYNAVESGRAMLAGVPADLKIFNDIVKEITEKGESVETEQGELKPLPKESIPFDDARTQFSAIGEKAYAAEGNLRRALFTLYDAYDKALNETANAAGAGKEYGTLKADWKQYMQDWHDMRSQTTGGSPLARLYRATDDPIVAQQILGKFGDRLMQTFAHYDKYGAAPTMMSKLRNLNTLAKQLPKVKVPAMPGKLEAPAEPKLLAEVAPPETVVPKSVSRPKLKETPEAPKPKVAEPMEPVESVNAFKTRLNRIENFTGTSFNFLDFIIPWRIANRLLLKNEAFKEWVASQPRSSDPDFVPESERGATPSNPAFGAAVEEVKKLNGGGMTAVKDYLRGSITRDGFRQRIQALFPNASAAEVDQVVAAVDKSKGTAKGKRVITPVTARPPSEPPTEPPPSGPAPAAPRTPRTPAPNAPVSPSASTATMAPSDAAMHATHDFVSGVTTLSAFESRLRQIFPNASQSQINSMIEKASTLKLGRMRTSTPAARPTVPMEGVQRDLWQHHVFGDPLQEDIGAKVRAKNPEPTRKEVQAAREKRESESQSGAPTTGKPISEMLGDLLKDLGNVQTTV